MQQLRNNSQQSREIFGLANNSNDDFRERSKGGGVKISFVKRKAAAVREEEFKQFSPGPAPLCFAFKLHSVDPRLPRLMRQEKESRL